MPIDILPILHAVHKRPIIRLLAAILLPALLLAPARAQSATQTDAQPNTPSDPPATEANPTAVTVFPHSGKAPWLISGQANIIFQAHPGFHSPYQGPNSMLPRGEYKTSLVGTLYTGLELLRNPQQHVDFILDFESAGGRGISEALGLAGFTNLDVVRNPNLGPVPYLARIQLHYTAGLSSKLTESDRNPFALATRTPERRIDLRVGRMSLPDILDLNSVGTDSHLQFLNWTVDNNGAWDYAADTRGYTYAAVAEYDQPAFSARYALALMPTVANGIDLQWNLHRASGQNIELEWRKPRTARDSFALADGATTVRFLSFVNRANMGDYRDQINLALANHTTPVITDHPLQTTVKYGFGLNAEQELSPNLRLFGRFGWNEGQHESYAYTEVDQTFEFGGDYAGARWHRPNDKLGLALVSNAIKRDHQHYLADGGLGFLLGDGRLNYAREDILESYYTAHNWRGLFTAFDVQLIAHPGYNQDRGPVAVFSIRTHVDF